MRTCLSRPHDLWPVGGIAQSGVYFTAPNRSLSGHDTDADARLHELANGGIFVDKRPVADDPRFVAWVCADPILTLNPEEEGATVNRDVLAIMWPFLGGNFAVIGAAALSGSACLDYEGLGAYLARWQARGARAGIRVDDVMHWNDGTTTEIPACRCWEGVCLGCNSLRYYVDRVYVGGWEPRARTPSGPDDHCPECRAKGRA